MRKSKIKLLGDLEIERKKFTNVDVLFQQFLSREFLTFKDCEKRGLVNRALCDLIQKEPEPCFLLSHVLDFVERVEKEKVLDHYTFTSFELWLNQSSNLSFEENYRIRAKIAGKWIERSDYQALFPIGMGKVYEGTHIVTAHKSPDLDTTVASFWGWVDAFAARVGDGLHLWNLPGGPPEAIEIEWMFRDVFGNGVFTHLSKNRTALNLTGSDLMNQKELVRMQLNDSIASIDYERDQKVVIVVDEEGFYLGDWRSVDVEGVRQVIVLLSSCIRWFENHLHLQIISLFTKDDLHFDEIAPKLKTLYGLKLRDCEPALGFSVKQKAQVYDFISIVLGVKDGGDATFERLISHLARLGTTSFEKLNQILHQMAPLFDSKGRLLEHRSQIFRFLENAIQGFHEAIFQIRKRLEQLDIAYKTKVEVFDHQPTFVTVRSDVEEIQSKMGSYFSLTVTYPEGGKFFPVGSIRASDLRKTFLGTVSLRDFCNRDEIAIPAYFEVISVIDHHKSQLNTFSPPLAIIADVQSSNTLVASRAFEINDRYSLAGQSVEKIDRQISDLQKESVASSRLLQQLLKRRNAASESPFFVHPDRERLEYFHFLYAILDDTDLLSKVSAPDVECVASLLNRLKTLSLGEETEIISFDDLPRDKNFPKKAAQRMLRTEEMYSLYRKVYAFREKEVERNMKLCVKGKPSSIFADTKEQNGCCRIGQTKMFANNIPYFFKHGDAMRRMWLDASLAVYQDSPEIDLHIHMISTVVSAEEVYQGKTADYSHKDELWLWIPQQELAIERLKRFLTRFQSSPGLQGRKLEVEFLGDNANELSLIFKESFFDVPHQIVRKNLPLAVVRFNAGALNSRKAMVSPFLPNS